MTRRRLIVLVALVCVAVAAVVALRPGVEPAADYFDFSTGQAFSGWLEPAAATLVGVATIQVAPGDTVTLLGLDGSPATSIAGARYVRLAESGGSLGMANEDEMSADALAQLDELAGATLTSADGWVDVILVARGQPQDVTIDGLQLRYVLNGGSALRQPVPTVVHICAGAPAGDCSVPTPPDPPGG